MIDVKSILNKLIDTSWLNVHTGDSAAMSTPGETLADTGPARFPPPASEATDQRLAPSAKEPDMSDLTPQAAAAEVTAVGEDPTERLTMEQRIQAFYAQSGGPGNPQITKFLDHHLRYGADHGVPGHKETVEDVFRDVVRKDKSLFTLHQLWMRRQAEKEERNAQRTDVLAELAEKIARLEGQIHALGQRR